MKWSSQSRKTRFKLVLQTDGKQMVSPFLRIPEGCRTNLHLLQGLWCSWLMDIDLRRRRVAVSYRGEHPKSRGFPPPTKPRHCIGFVGKDRRGSGHGEFDTGHDKDWAGKPGSLGFLHQRIQRKDLGRKNQENGGDRPVDSRPVPVGWRDDQEGGQQASDVRSHQMGKIYELREEEGDNMRCIHKCTLERRCRVARDNLADSEAS